MNRVKIELILRLKNLELEVLERPEKTELWREPIKCPTSDLVEIEISW